jgi:hypothetical protein
VEDDNSNHNQLGAVSSVLSASSVQSPPRRVNTQPNLGQQQSQQEDDASTYQDQFPKSGDNPCPTLTDDYGFFSEWNWSVDGYFTQESMDQLSGMDI